MRIGEVSQQTGVSVRSLRHYESAGLIQAERQSNSYRHFGGDTVDRVAGFTACCCTAAHWRLLLPCYEAPPGAAPLCVRAGEQYAAKLEEIDRRIQVMTDLRERILAHMKAGEAFDRR